MMRIRSKILEARIYLITGDFNNAFKIVENAEATIQENTYLNIQKQITSLIEIIKKKVAQAQQRFEVNKELLDGLMMLEISEYIHEVLKVKDNINQK